jgi:hypothetical protein
MTMNSLMPAPESAAVARRMARSAATSAAPSNVTLTMAASSAGMP